MHLHECNSGGREPDEPSFPEVGLRGVGVGVDQHRDGRADTAALLLPLLCRCGSHHLPADLLDQSLHFQRCTLALLVRPDHQPATKNEKKKQPRTTDP